MQNRISEEIRGLRKRGVDYTGIHGHILRTYGLDLTPDEVDRYANMKVPRAYRVPLIAGTAISTVLIIGGVLFAVNRNEYHKPPKQEQAATVQLAPEDLFSKYILLRTDGGYVMDFNQDKKPDGVVSQKMLEAADNILNLDGKIDAELLLRSLYEIRADDFIIKSPEQIIAVTGKPSQFTVYQIGTNGLTVNAQLNDAWQQINNQILSAVSSSNASVEQKRETVERALKSNPEAASLTLGLVGGADFGKYLQQQNAGLAITNYYSELARGNFSAAAGSLATGNVAGVIGNLFAAWFTEQAAKATIQGLEAGGRTANDQYERMPSGEYKRIIVVDPKAGVQYEFTDPTEAEKKRREIEERNK